MATGDFSIHQGMSVEHQGLEIEFLIEEREFEITISATTILGFEKIDIPKAQFSDFLKWLNRWERDKDV